MPSGKALSALLLLLLSAVLSASLVAAESYSCSFLNTPPYYTFLGGGFHMQLAIEYPAAAKEARITFDLPRSFFIDAAEAEQLYRMEVISPDSLHQGTAATVLSDVTDVYSPLQMTSQYFFDIEAPVFKVNYTENFVELKFHQRDGTHVLDTYLGSAENAGTAVRARLVIPIHSRYDALDTTTPFSFTKFVLGEDAYVHRCVPKVNSMGTADARCGTRTYISVASVQSLKGREQFKTCLDLPVGVLADLPYVYRALMGLLVGGAVIVILAIR